MFRSAYLFVIVFLMSNSFVFGQRPQNQPRTRVDNFSIRGKIIIPNSRESDQRIEVRLEKSPLQVIQTTYTDSSGSFEFRNLPAGAYYISVQLEGYEPVQQLVELFNSFGTTSVTIMLNKPAVEFRERLTGLDAVDPTVVDVSQMKENFPKKAVQNFEKAVEEREKGRLENAVKLLEEAIQLAPNFLHAHNNLGILYQSLKQYEDAEREYRRSHELNSKAERPLVNLGSLFIERSNLEGADEEARGRLLDQALDALEEAVRLNPRSALGHLLLGQANYRSNFLEEAEAAFKKAHELDPRLGAARLMLANVFVKLRKWQEVIDTLDAYLKDNPEGEDRASVEQLRARIAANLQAVAEPESSQ